MLASVLSLGSNGNISDKELKYFIFEYKETCLDKLFLLLKRHKTL